MNPARSFGPALWHNNFSVHWIYWVGPLTSAFVATYLYKYVFYRENPKVNESETVKEMSPLNA